MAWCPLCHSDSPLSYGLYPSSLPGGRAGGPAPNIGGGELQSCWADRPTCRTNHAVIVFLRSFMTIAAFQADRERLFAEHEALIQRPNEPMKESRSEERRVG